MKIGNYIVKLLEDLKVPVYPLVAPEGVDSCPWITYSVDKVDFDYTKDGSCEDMAHVQLSIIARTYAEGVELAEKCRKTINNADSEKCSDFTVDECECESYSENYVDALPAYEFILNIKLLIVREYE